MGTPAFAVPSLRELAGRGHRLLAVITRPDARKGRGLEIHESPVKTLARERALPILQPADLRDPLFLGQLKELDPDLLVVVAFKILPREVLDIPRLGAVNLHPSLLPRYRGAAPIPWAIARGETETGMTVFFLNQVVDGGDVLSRERIPIGPAETAGELTARLSEQGGVLLADCVDRIARGDFEREPQSDAGATPAPKIRKEDARIDFSMPARVIYNRMRAFTPAPGPYTFFRGTRLQVLSAEPVPGDTLKKAGTVIRADAAGIRVQTGEGGLLLKTVKPENRKAMEARDFINGFKIRENDAFDD